MKKLEWKIGEEGSEGVIARNLHMMDEVVQRYEKCCANPFCNYPISALRETSYGAPEYGDICATCHALFMAVSQFNPNLSRPTYFKDLHEQWLKENKAIIDKRKREDREY